MSTIQGDGISYETLDSIINALDENKWSLDNVTFGSGGALLQKLDRDTQKCAFKCCLATINGQDKDVFKQPITDLGKQSKRGNITLVKNDDGSYDTVRREDMTDQVDMLKEVFRNGQLTLEDDLETIRKRTASEL